MKMISEMKVRSIRWNVKKFLYEKANKMNIKDMFARKIFYLCGTKDISELAAGYLQYKALCKLQPLQFEELCRRNLAGENFDDMVTELAVVRAAGFFSKEKTK